MTESKKKLSVSVAVLFIVHLSYGVSASNLIVSFWDYLEDTGLWIFYYSALAVFLVINAMRLYKSFLPYSK